jgi:pimeloyl-ACP methyl ester carboxylesterase
VPPVSGENSPALVHGPHMTELALPTTRYARSGEVSIAYQTMGDGPIDLILVFGIISNIEFMHEIPGYTDYLRRLATFARVVTFDKRGQGLSDRVPGVPSLEERMDDVSAIMDAIRSKRAALLGVSEGASMSTLFAATYPERMSHLVLYGGFARFTNTTDYQLMFPEEVILRTVKHWGTGAFLKGLAPSRAKDPTAVSQFAKFERLSGSPGAFRALVQQNALIDVRSILANVRVPTLVLHRQNDTMVPVENGRFLASRIPGAKYIEYVEGAHLFFDGDVQTMCGDIKEFITGDRDNAILDLERILATVLFTNIVDSTRRAAEIGDQSWRRLLDEHDRLARRLVEKYRGKLVKTTGDGSSPRSTDRGERSAARWISKQRPGKSDCHCVLAFIPGKSKSGTGTSAASQSMPRRASWRFPVPAKFSYRE